MNEDQREAIKRMARALSDAENPETRNGQLVAEINALLKDTEAPDAYAVLTRALANTIATDADKDITKLVKAVNGIVLTLCSILNLTPEDIQLGLGWNKGSRRGTSN